MRHVLLFLILVVAACSDVCAQFTITARQPLCYDSCNGSVLISALSGGHYRYLWSTGDTLPSVSNLCAGPYQCTVSDSLGNALDTLSIAVQQPPQLIFSPQTLNNHVCYGDTNGYVIFNATGGTGNRYAFTWSNGYQGFLSNGNQFHLPAGTYAVTITDANACSASTGFAITQPPQITITTQVTNATGCALCNGAASAEAAGGSSAPYNFIWSTGATSSAITGLCNGGYGLSVTDTSGCLVTTRVNVFANQSPVGISFSIVTNIDCTHPTGLLFASATGGRPPYNYNWSTGSTAPDIYNLPAGVYEVSATDSVGCFAEATDTIKNLGIVITTVLKQDFRCDINAGKIIISVSQGSPPYIFNWNTEATTDTLSGLRPGNYTVTVTDQQDCTTSNAYTIEQNNNYLFVQAAGNNVTCSNINNGTAIAVVTGGLAPLEYLWNDSTHQQNDTAVGLAVGSYRVRVIDAYGCSVFAGVNILEGYAGLVTATTTIGNCDSLGSATASISVGTPPYTYLWNTQPAQATATAHNLAPGNYIVSVTDAAGCARTDSVNIQYSCIGLVTGKVFYDNNANCVIDNGEQGVAGVPVYVTNSHVTFEGTTNLSGEYSIPVTATGAYKIVLGVSASSAILQYGNSACGYIEDCPAGDTLTFVTLRDTFQNYNFGFVGSSDFDLAINAGWAPVNANGVKEYWILYANEAFLNPDTSPATIIFNYDPDLTFQSGIPSPVNDVANHTLTWTVDSIPSPTFVWAKRVQAFFTVPTELPPDYQLVNDFHIEPYAGDCDTVNNSIYTQEIAGLPTVPISKEVSPPGEIPFGDSLLTYTIHFQNNGPDTAGYVIVTDSLSPYLDPASVQNTCSSPLYNLFYTAPGAALTWIFFPANIPDSAVNPIASAGFISFTVKIKPGTRPGYYINNNASVSIGNGAPVFTNTTSNFIAFPLPVVDLAGNSIGVRAFPNPFNQFTNIEVSGITGKYDFELMDMEGRVTRKLTSITSDMFQLNSEGLSAGVYVYRIYIDKEPVAYGKLVVQ